MTSRIDAALDVTLSGKGDKTTDGAKLKACVEAFNAETQEGGTTLYE